MIRTLPKTHREKWSYFGSFGGFWHRNKPGLSKRFHDDYVYYNETCDFLEKEHENVRIHQIAPANYLETTSYNTSTVKLNEDYKLGFELGLAMVQKLKRKKKGFK